MWEFPSDGIMILFNSEHNSIYGLYAFSIFSMRAREVWVLSWLCLLCSLSLSFSDVGLNLRKLGEIELPAQ